MGPACAEAAGCCLKAVPNLSVLTARNLTRIRWTGTIYYHVCRSTRKKNSWRSNAGITNVILKKQWDKEVNNGATKCKRTYENTQTGNAYPGSYKTWRKL